MTKHFKKSPDPYTIPRILFIFSLCVLSFAYGYLSLAFGIFPHKIIRTAVEFIEEQTREPELPWYYIKTDSVKMIPVHDEASAANGLSLVSSVMEDGILSARVIGMDGKLIHSWDIDWFDLWPDVSHVPKSDPYYPKSRPGTHIHGALLLENGDLIFNFTNLGLVRLDVCGNVVWRVDRQTHHSIHLDENGYLWVPGLIWQNEPLPDLPNHNPPFIEYTILKISLDGEVLQEISIFDIMKENDLLGLLNLSSLADKQASVSGDTLHLNDVETFPSDLEEGVFAAGDIMISLRNINTIMILDAESLRVKHISTGAYVRQHDPDFIDGNTISVFDNYNIGPEEYGQQSRILIESFASGNHYTYYAGSEEQPFYSVIMGNHQWLPNGNLLITESSKGRAFEIDPQGKIVWEFVNLLNGEYAGIVEDVLRLPDSFTEGYFNQLTQSCGIAQED